jgi:hypothetical protein
MNVTATADKKVLDGTDGKAFPALGDASRRVRGEGLGRAPRVVV